MTKRLTVIIALIAGVSLGVGTTELLHSQTSNAGACHSRMAQSQSHNIMIMDGHVEPAMTSGKLCDTVTITNMDSAARELAFGPHEAHVAYDGVAEKVLNAGQSFTITLSEVGYVRFHDHLQDAVMGHISVTR